MSKFCSDCGKEILLGNKCIDCAKKAQEEAEASANKIDYKKLTFRICLILVMVTVAIVYVCITDNTAEKEVTQNTSQTDTSDYEQDENFAESKEVLNGEEKVSLVKLDDFLKSHDDLVENVSISGKDEFYLENCFNGLTTEENEEMPMSDYYPSVSKRYRYDVTKSGNDEVTSIDILTDSENNILYIGHKILETNLVNNSSASNTFFIKDTFLFAAMSNRDFNSAYDNELSKAWNLATDNITGNDELEFGNYKYFYTSNDGYFVFAIRAKFDNE